MPPQASALGALGANYNANLTWLDHDELRKIGSAWVRGFIDMHHFNHVNPLQGPNIKALLGAADAGFKIIVSLKWDYHERDWPSEGTPEHDEELHRLRRLLPVVMGRADILVIGNEPTIESRTRRCDLPPRFNDFYESMAQAVFDFRRRAGGGGEEDAMARTRLYMGAFVRLDLPANRTPAIERMLAYIAGRPELDGVDLHLHIKQLDGHRAMLDYALARIRPDQKFLATEFSLVWLWDAHRSRVVSGHYRAKYGLPADTTVIQVLNAAIRSPMPYAQWEDFLTHEKWYADRRGFLADTMKLYRETGRLEVATYGMSPLRHRKDPMPAEHPLWLLNGLFVPSTVQLHPDGTRPENFPWAEEFRRAQGQGGR
ncbi:hypothetical protein GGR56DRAFT_158410 [Xylariaceae sp. FL0804]|nr:hypothetical protein GGR56DRAFT_158410 [Xylariaceae sp. FL0804]